MTACIHLGRPIGVDQSLSLAPVARRLSELLDAEVKLAPPGVGEDVAALAAALAPGELLLLENIRFEPGETNNDPELAASLASLADVYVDDAFGAAHRAHASTEGVARLMPERAAGLLLDREVTALSQLLESPSRPFLAVLGGLGAWGALASNGNSSSGHGCPAKTSTLWPSPTSSRAR